MDGNLKDSVMRKMNERNQQSEKKAFNRWKKDLLSQQNRQVPRSNFNVDIDLQSLRWMSLGVVLLRSSVVVQSVQLADGVQGRPIKSYLRYPVFQMGVEIFLKGMWLCQFPECRRFTHHSYVDSSRREKYRKELKELVHDLIKILGAIRRIPKYKNNAASVRSLDLFEQIIRRYYFPLQCAKRNPWAANRYPIRFYDDAAKESRATFYEWLPPPEWIERTFRPMEARAIRLLATAWPFVEKRKGED